MDVAYFQFGSDNPFQDRFYRSVEAQGVRVHPLSYRPLLPLAQARNYDILQLDWLHPFYKGTSLLKSRLKKILLRMDLSSIKAKRIVWTVHNLISHDSYLPAAFERACMKQLIRRVDAFMVFSEAVGAQLTQEYPAAEAKPKFVVPHGHYVDDYAAPQIRNESRRQMGLPEDCRLILFFGSLRSNKGLPDLISAVQSLSDQNIHLLIAGGAETPDVTAVLDNLPADVNIHTVRRFISAKELPTYFGAADVVALPFRSILNSGSAMLALSMSRCVVIPDFPTITESIPQFARFTYAPGNTADLGRALKAAISRRDLAERGTQAREYVRKHYEWNNIGKQAVAMYQELLPGSNVSNDG